MNPPDGAVFQKFRITFTRSDAIRQSVSPLLKTVSERPCSNRHFANGNFKKHNDLSTRSNSPSLATVGELPSDVPAF